MRERTSESRVPGRWARRLAGLAAAALIAAGVAPAWAQRTAPGPQRAPLPSPTPMPSPDPESGYSERTLQQGDRWRLVEASGYTLDDGGQYYQSRLFMIQDADGVRNAPLSPGLKLDLLRLLGSTNAAFTLSQEVVQEIASSEQAGQLSPALLAIAEPLDPLEDGPVEPFADEPGLSPGDAQMMRLFGRCKDRVINRSKPFDIQSPLNGSFNTNDGFTGNLSLTGSARATGTGEIQVRLKRYAVFGFCVPYGVRFDYARAYGTVSASYGDSLSGNLNYTSPDPSNPKRWEWQIAKPHLFSLDFWIAIIPVHVGFNLPITAGLELRSLSVSGFVTYTDAQSVTGQLDYTCTLDGCNGTSSFTSTNPQPQPVSAQITGRAEPSVYAQVAVRGYLYSEGFAYAQVGLRPYLHADVWGYYGNACGDATGDSFYETVDALTLDLDWQLWITAQADTFLTGERRWMVRDLFGRRHIRFWDLIGSSALEPMLLGPAAVPAGVSQPYTLKMRPCWPYTEAVNYDLSWGDGSQASFTAPAATWVQTQHAWATTGPKALSLKAVRDSHGRVFDATTGRTVEVNAGGTATHLGMTWRVLEQRGAYAHVGADAATNPYTGDAGPNASWPVLCLRQDGRPEPPGITFDFYNGWAAGEVRTTAPVLGSTLTSRAVADALCASSFGAGFRMAEFHDGGGGWTWWAQGAPLASVRLWVAIDDQPANPWN